MKPYFHDKSKVIEKIKSFRKLRSASLIRFINSTVDAYEVAKIIESKSKSKRIRNQAKKNLVINLVTNLEVLLKEIIQENKGNWNKVGLESLLKEKISLGEAFELFESYKPTREDLLSSILSFQSLESIESVFSKLTGKNFLNAVGQYKYLFTEEQKRLFYKNEDLVFNRDIPSWKNLLKQIYDHRHVFVHESTHRRDIEIDSYPIMMMVLQLGPAFWATTVYKKF